VTVMGRARKVVGGDVEADGAGGVPLLRVGAARRMAKARYARLAGDAELSRQFYGEVMAAVDDGRVALEVAKTALELCIQEIEERQEQMAEGADWTLGGRWR